LFCTDPRARNFCFPHFFRASQKPGPAPMTFSGSQYDAQIQRDSRVLHSVVRKFALFCVCNVIFLCMYRVYLGPYTENYARRVESHRKAKKYLALDVCSPENRADLENYNNCEDSLRKVNQYVWVGAFSDTLDQLSPFDVFFGKNGSLVSPEFLFRLTCVSLVAIAVVWVASACGMLYDGHKSMQAQYMLPYTAHAARYQQQGPFWGAMQGAGGGGCGKEEKQE